jgi:hypothetical protein
LMASALMASVVFMLQACRRELGNIIRKSPDPTLMIHPQHQGLPG